MSKEISIFSSTGSFGQKVFRPKFSNLAENLQKKSKKIVKLFFRSLAGLPKSLENWNYATFGQNAYFSFFYIFKQLKKFFWPADSFLKF